MNKKFFIAAGAVVLAAASVMAGRATVKFSSPSTIYVSTAGGGCRALTVVTPSLNNFTTGAASGNQATIKTISNTKTRKIWGTSTCALGGVKVYFHG